MSAWPLRLPTAVTLPHDRQTASPCVGDSSWPRASDLALAALFFYSLAVRARHRQSITCSGRPAIRPKPRRPRGADRALCDRHSWHTEDVGRAGAVALLLIMQSLGVIRPRGGSANFRCAASSFHCGNNR